MKVASILFILWLALLAVWLPKQFSEYNRRKEEALKRRKGG
jgi:hypothetical protein